ncbi:MAG: DEAD/DEAH box helicase [Nitratireductor sp.]|nr:DEAD/DEAH box helicase [Nitratireductor sp.]
MNAFEALGLSPKLMPAIKALGYSSPTPIQASAIPHVLEGKDIMGLAQTGTGKTAAFGLPLVQRLLDDKTRPQPRSIRALILAPTRELANQIGDNLRGFVKGTPLRIVTVVGGASINTQTRNLERGADVLIATPGRLLDLSERGAVRIASAKFLVLDEADQMLDLGFIHALRKIAAMVGTPRQTMLFSATMPKEIAQLAKTFLIDPVRVETAAPGKPAEKVAQFVHFVPQARKADLLKELLLRDPNHLSLVFARTKHGTEKLMKNLVASGIDAVSIHGNKSQNQRERAIRQFREGEARVLVATDVAARGIDIPGVSHVYNHDLPEVPEAYVHRIGRTARAGAAGEAVSLCAPDEGHLLRAVEKLTGIAVTRLNEPAASQGGNGGPAGREERRGEQRNGRRQGRGNRKPQGHGKPRDAEIAHVRVSEGNYQPRSGRPEGAGRNNGSPAKPAHGMAHTANARPQRPHRQSRRPERAAAY